MASTLYTLPGCKYCDKAREVLAASQEEYREVVVDDPLTQRGMMVSVGKLLAPLLVRQDGQFYFLVADGDAYRFVRLLV